MFLHKLCLISLFTSECHLISLAYSLYFFNTAVFFEGSKVNEHLEEHKECFMGKITKQHSKVKIEYSNKFHQLT